jgi:hypothetical protein
MRALCVLTADVAAIAFHCFDYFDCLDRDNGRFVIVVIVITTCYVLFDDVHEEITVYTIIEMNMQQI